LLIQINYKYMPTTKLDLTNVNNIEQTVTATPTASSIPIADGSGKLDNDWMPNEERVSIKTLNAGATINGATLPVPVYQNTADNEIYASDGNDTAKLKFIGFAISNSTDGNPITVQTSGIVGVFTGLTEGTSYYVQDTVGTIGTTPGTYEVLVGIAISETQLLVQKGKRYASGTTTFASVSTQTITVGFRVSRVRINALKNSGAETDISNGGWTHQGGNDAVRSFSSVTADSTTNAWLLGSGTTGGSGIVDTITSTTFRLNENAHGSDGNTLYLFWEAEGEL
jgi:hypothetical protein